MHPDMVMRWVSKINFEKVSPENVSCIGKAIPQGHVTRFQELFQALWLICHSWSSKIIDRYVHVHIHTSLALQFPN